MSNIKVTFKDGQVKEFLHEGRPGGSYTKRAQFKDGWLIITDEYYRETVYPATDIAEVKVEPNRLY